MIGRMDSETGDSCSPPKREGASDSELIAAVADCVGADGESKNIHASVRLLTA